MAYAGDQRLTGPIRNLVRDAVAPSLGDQTAVTIWLGKRDGVQYTGPVAKLTDDAGTILDLDEYGAIDREVSFRIVEIRSLDLGDEHECIVQHLAEQHPGTDS